MGHVSPVNLHGIDYISYVYYNQDPDNFDNGRSKKKFFYYTCNRPTQPHNFQQQTFEMIFGHLGM